MHVQQFLTNQGVWFERIEHRPTYTARSTARMLHVAPSEVAKSVLLRSHDGLAIAVVPAESTADLSAVSARLGVKDISLVHESEILASFPDCEIGSLPPFGSQYGIRTIVDESLASLPEIVIEGNMHSEAIRMRFADFAKIERPLVAGIAKHAQGAATS